MLQGPKLEGDYAHQVGLSELRILGAGTSAGTVLKLALDVRDGDEVAVRLMSRGPAVSPPCPFAPFTHKSLSLRQRSQVWKPVVLVPGHACLSSTDLYMHAASLGSAHAWTRALNAPGSAS